MLIPLLFLWLWDDELRKLNEKMKRRIGCRSHVGVVLRAAVTVRSERNATCSIVTQRCSVN
jgi:hypothetical protein